MDILRLGRKKDRLSRHHVSEAYGNEGDTVRKQKGATRTVEKGSHVGTFKIIETIDTRKTERRQEKNHGFWKRFAFESVIFSSSIRWWRIYISYNKVIETSTSVCSQSLHRRPNASMLPPVVFLPNPTLIYHKNNHLQRTSSSANLAKDHPHQYHHSGTCSSS